MPPKTQYMARPSAKSRSEWVAKRERECQHFWQIGLHNSQGLPLPEVPSSTFCGQGLQQGNPERRGPQRGRTLAFQRQSNGPRAFSGGEGFGGMGGALSSDVLLKNILVTRRGVSEQPLLQRCIWLNGVHGGHANTNVGFNFLTILVNTLT